MQTAKPIVYIKSFAWSSFSFPPLAGRRLARAFAPSARANDTGESGDVESAFEGPADAGQLVRGMVL